MRLSAPSLVARSLFASLIAFGFVLAGFVFLTGPAAAQPQRHRHHRHVAIYPEQPPLTVNKRSWLDPGPVIQPGTGERYMVESGIFQRTPDQVYFPSRFNEDAMPRPLYVPGNMTPLVEFETPRDPFGP